MTRPSRIAASVVLGLAATGFAIASWEGARSSIATLPGMSWLAAAHTESHPDLSRDQKQHEHQDELVKMTERQVEAAGIRIGEAGEGALSRRVSAPGSIVPSSDRIARVAVKLVGTVAELRKRLGDSVALNEIVAVVESREVADAKSEYLATKTTNDLQQTLFARAKRLWESKVSSENDYLRAQALAEDARIKMEVARQKLFALGLTEEEISALPAQPAALMRRHELRAQMAGRVAERRVDLGALVGREGQESELYIIVDLDEVWAELAVPPAHLASIREGQSVSLRAAATRQEVEAKIVFIGPLLEKETRSARVVAAFANPEHAWRPGTFITAEISLEKQPARIVIPKTALQSVRGERVVFARREDGFEVRKVTTGREDDRAIEVLDGLEPGDRLAVTNTFIIKAELGKAEAHED